MPIFLPVGGTSTGRGGALTGPSSSLVSPSSTLSTPSTLVLSPPIVTVDPDAANVTQHVNADMTTASKIHAFYCAFGDMGCTRLMVDATAGARPSVFTTNTTKKLRLFALSAGGSGLSVRDRALYWESLLAVEQDALEGTGRVGRLQTMFLDAAAFVRLLKGEQDRAMLDKRWRVTDITVDGATVPFYSRDLMGVLVEAAEGAARIAVRGERRFGAGGERMRTGALDSDLFLEEQEDVFMVHSYDVKGNMFVMATQLYSDAALVSRSGGTDALD